MIFDRCRGHLPVGRNRKGVVAGFAARIGSIAVREGVMPVHFSYNCM